MAHGFLRRLFEVFERHKTSVDVVTTSEVSVSVTIDDPRRLPAIIEGLSGFARVEREDDMAIVCVVGDGLHRGPGACGAGAGVGGRRAAAHGVAGGVAPEHHLRDPRSRLAIGARPCCTTSSSRAVSAA